MTSLIRVFILVLIVIILSIGELGCILITRVVNICQEGKLLWIIEYAGALA